MEELGAKEQICQHLNELGYNQLFCWLDNHGFFEAPASCSHHGAYAGALAEHSLRVAQHLEDITRKMGVEWNTPESPFLVGLLHDVCKLDAYVYNSEKGIYEYNQNTLYPGHGDKSIMILASLPFLTLTEEEIACIRFHMGAFTDSKEWGNYSRACAKYPTVLWTHTADMLASQIDGI